MFINSSGDILLCCPLTLYVVMWLEFKWSLSQRAVSQGTYQWPNSCTQSTDSGARELESWLRRTLRHRATFWAMLLGNFGQYCRQRQPGETRPTTDLKKCVFSMEKCPSNSALKRPLVYHQPKLMWMGTISIWVNPWYDKMSILKLYTIL